MPRVRSVTPVVVWLLLVAGTLAGCSFAEPSLVGLPCPCAGDYVCVAGRCVAARDDGGPASEGGAGLVTDGLFLHWAFDEADGSIAEDSSGNGVKGLVEGAMRIEGVSGGALTFDGEDDQVLGTLLDTQMFTAPYSVAFWMRFTADASERHPFSCPGANMKLTTGEAVVTAFGAGTGTWPNYDATIVRGDPPGWRHVVIVAEEASVKVHYDGVRVASAPYTLPLPDPTPGGTCAVGTANLGESSLFAGSVDEFRVYDRALTDDEIELLAKQ